MTTDDFTKAAREKASEKWNDTVSGRVRQVDFVAGAEWARTHLAAQEPTDAEAEAAADVLAESGDTGSVETARAALSAARAARRDEEKR